MKTSFVSMLFMVLALFGLSFGRQLENYGEPHKEVKYVKIEDTNNLKQLQERINTGNLIAGTIDPVEPGYGKYKPYAEVFFLIPQLEKYPKELFVSFITSLRKPGKADYDIFNPVETYRVIGSDVSYPKEGEIKFDLKTKKGVVKRLAKVDPLPYGLKTDRYYA